MTQTVSLMVKTEGFGERIRKSFLNNAGEIVAEVLQNSQRSQSRNISFTTGETTLKITDDGSGITALPSPDKELERAGLTLLEQAWAKLLRAMDSFYSDPEIDFNQMPNGVGILSLLAASEVSEVIFRSRGLKARIETAKFWASTSYWESWLERLELDPETENQAGLTIEVKATEEFIKQIQKALTDEKISAAIGYENILRVTLNGAEVNTALPAKYRSDKNILLKTTFTDQDGIAHPLTLYRPSKSVPFHFYDPSEIKESLVLWYGQRINAVSIGNEFGKLKFLLEVANGKPVTPLAPTRRSIIADERARFLRNFIEREVFKFAAAPENRAQVDLKLLQTLIQINRERFLKEINYAAIAPVSITDPAECSTVGDFINAAGYESRVPAGTKILTYEELSDRKNEISLIEPDVFVFDKGADDRLEWFACDYGAASFEKTFERKFFTLLVGDAEKLDISQIWWKPGCEFHAQAEMFHTAGTAALARTESRTEDALKNPPSDESFIPVKETAFAFAYSDSYNFADGSEIIVGVENLETETLVKWLETYAMCAFDYDEEGDGEETYRQSVSDLIESLMKDSISTDISLRDLIARTNRELGNNTLKTGFSEPEKIEFDNEAKTIKIVLADGKEKSFRIYNPQV